MAHTPASPGKRVPIATLEQALARIAELEARFEEAVDILLKRDEQLSTAERRIAELEERLGLDDSCLSGRKP